MLSKGKKEFKRETKETKRVNKRPMEREKDCKKK